MPDSFYTADGDRLVPTELTRGPWDPNAQHGGPVAALFGRSVEACEAAPDLVVGRITIEILRPVPLAPLTVGARVARPGKKVEFVEASMSTVDGTEVARASAWRMRPAPDALPDVAADIHELPPPPEGARSMKSMFAPEILGYWSGVDWRFSVGSFLEPGPAASWIKMRAALVDAEAPTPLVRALIAADVGNGISGVLDFATYVFINTDLTVHLQRMPSGEWVCVQARTAVQPGGAGLAESVLYDRTGPFGRGAQTLYVASR
jgi:Thioesterase-like superfamily